MHDPTNPHRVTELTLTPPCEGTLATTDDSMTLSVTVTPGIIPRPLAIKLLAQEARTAADAIEEWTAGLLDRWADQIVAQMRHEHEKNITDTYQEDQQ